MITKTGEGTMNSGRGVTFDAPVKFSFTYSEYKDSAEQAEHNDLMTLDEQLKQRNSERLASARNKALNAKLDEMGIEKQDENNNDGIRLKKVYQGLISAKQADGTKLYTEDEAKAMAANMLRLEWPASLKV